MKPIPKCPYCKRDLIKMVNLSPLEPEKYYCPVCGRVWYQHDINDPRFYLSEETKEILRNAKELIPGGSDD